MYSSSNLIKSVNSFRNLSSAVLRYIEQDSKNVRVVSPVIGLTINSTRQRIRKPYLWQINEIEKLASYYKLSPAVCVQLLEEFSHLWAFLDELPQAQRKHFKTVCQFKPKRVGDPLNANSSIAEIEQLYQGLTNWLANKSP